MATSNRNTQQPPITGNSIKLILAERCYAAPTGQTYDHSVPSKLSDNLPASPWVDLGIVEGSKVTITYNKDVAYVETGIDKIRRGSYLRGKNAQAKFQLTQVDHTVYGALGLNVDAVSGGYQVIVGQEDVVEKALLFVGTNKLDGKEHQTYSDDAAVSFGYAEAEDARLIDVTAELFAFTPYGESVDALYVLWILA
jgi:hypothetical protein